MKKAWTEDENEILKARFPITKTDEICKELNRSYSSVSQQARILGLKKDTEFRKMQLKETYTLLMESGVNHRFKKGDKPANKGKKQTEFMRPQMIERTKATRFKKGQTPHNTKYEGHERVSKDGYVEVRVRAGKYVHKHRYIWEQAHGLVPKHHIIIFKDGNRQNLSLDNLEMISRKQHGENTRNKDSYIAKTMAMKCGSRGKYDKELQQELLKHPELLELKRMQLKLNQLLKDESKPVRRNARKDIYLQKRQ